VAGARPARDARVDHGDRGPAALNAAGLRGQIERNLAAFTRRPVARPLIAAAVALVVVDLDGEPAVPIFQRTADMRRHAGQMALPGGKLHEGESPVEGAIRELGEELGLALAPEDAAGLLDDFETRSGFTITPVVFWSGQAASRLHPSPEEVAQLVVIPLGELRRAAAEAGRGAEFSLRFPQVEVFAPTAAILYQFSEVALAGKEVRVADFFQPPFTHR
jgi:8-oxo-dGTP pyrophosphatase MutT (NUDIX family)